jgi:F0F1-type ATP synthase assembly protein I
MKNKIDTQSSSLGAQIMMASELGGMIVGFSIAGYLAGNWLDGRFGWSPYGVVSGILVGLTLGMVFVVKRSGEIDRRGAASAAREKSPEK